MRCFIPTDQKQLQYITFHFLLNSFQDFRAWFQKIANIKKTPFHNFEMFFDDKTVY